MSSSQGAVKTQPRGRLLARLSLTVGGVLSGVGGPQKACPASPSPSTSPDAGRGALFAARFSLLTPRLWSLYLQIEETRVNIDKISEHVEEAKRLYSVILSAPIPEPSE